jgi:hypothetical protein
MTLKGRKLHPDGIQGIRGFQRHLQWLIKNWLIMRYTLIYILQAIDEKIMELSNCHILYARIDFKKVNFLSWSPALYNGAVNFSSEPLFHICVNHCFL